MNNAEYGTFEEAEALLYKVVTVEKRLMNYERRLSKAIRRQGPSGISPIDLSKPVVQGSRPEMNLHEVSEEIARLTLAIQEIKDETGDILTTVSQLSAPERRVIELWYFKRARKQDIAESLHYSSVTSIYNLRDKAIQRFIELYPW